jgi:hypothetical protein
METHCWSTFFLLFSHTGCAKMFSKLGTTFKDVAPVLHSKMYIQRCITESTYGGQGCGPHHILDRLRRERADDPFWEEWVWVWDCLSRSGPVKCVCVCVSCPVTTVGDKSQRQPQKEKQTLLRSVPKKKLKHHQQTHTGPGFRVHRTILFTPGHVHQFGKFRLANSLSGMIFLWLIQCLFGGT